MTDFQRFHPPPSCSSASSSHQSAKAAAWAWLQRRSVQTIAPSASPLHPPRFPSAAADHNRSLHSSDHDLFNQSDRLLQRRHNSFSPTPSRFKPRADFINRSSNNNDRCSADSSDQSVNSCSSNPMGRDIVSPQLFMISSPVSTHHGRMNESRTMSSSSSWSPTSRNSDSSSGSNYYDRKWTGMANSDLAWDCGSSLFDCFELVAMAKNLKLDDGMLLQQQEGHDVQDAWLRASSSCGKRQPVDIGGGAAAAGDVVVLNTPPEDVVVLNPQFTYASTETDDDHYDNRSNVHASIESEMLVQNSSGTSSSRSSAHVEDQICSNYDSAHVVSCADLWNYAAQQVPIRSSSRASSLFDDFELVVTAKKLEENDVMVDRPPDNLPIHTAHLPTNSISNTTGSISPPDSAHDQQPLDEVISQILRHQDAITVSEKDPCVNVDDVRDTGFSDSFAIASDRCRVITIDDQRISDRSADSYHPTDLGQGAYQEQPGRYPPAALMKGDRDESSSNLGWDGSRADHVSKLDNDSRRAYYTFADLLRPPRINEEGCFSFPLPAAGTPVQFGALDRVADDAFETRSAACTAPPVSSNASQQSEETNLDDAVDGPSPAPANWPLQMDTTSIRSSTTAPTDREIVVTAATLRAGSQSRFTSGVQSPRRLNHHQPESADAKFNDALFRSTSRGESPETGGCRKNCERQETHQKHLWFPRSPQNDDLQHLKQDNFNDRGGHVDWEYGETPSTARINVCSTMYDHEYHQDFAAASGSIIFGVDDGGKGKHTVQMMKGSAAVSSTTTPTRGRLRKAISASMKSVSGLLKASKYRLLSGASPVATAGLAAVDDDGCSSTSCATSDFCSTIASPCSCRSKEPPRCDDHQNMIHHIHHHHFHYVLPRRRSDASVCGKEEKFGDVAVEHYPSVVAASKSIFNLEGNAGGGADDDHEGGDEILVLFGKGASMSAATASAADSVEGCGMSDNHTNKKKGFRSSSCNNNNHEHYHHHGGATPCKQRYSLQSTHSLLSAYLTSPIGGGGKSGVQTTQRRSPRHAHLLANLATWPTIHS